MAHLPPGRTSVGTVVRLEHTAASPIGMRVTVAAELIGADGRHLTFSVTATDVRDTAVGVGTIERIVIDREQFLGRLPT